MAFRAPLRRYGAWLVDCTAALRWCLTRLLTVVGIVIAVAAFLVLVALPQIQIGTGNEAGSDSIPASMLIFAVVAGSAGLITGVVGNVAANRCMKWYERRTPDIAEFFGNHQLTRLVGQSLAMIIRAFAGGLTNPQEQSAVNRLAHEVETNWEKVALTPSARQSFTPLMEQNLVAFVRNPWKPPLTPKAWLCLLNLFLPDVGRPEIPTQRLEDLARMLSDRFGFALRMALKRDFALRGEAPMGMVLDISRQLLQQANGRPVLDDEAKQALENIQKSLTRSVQLLAAHTSRYTQAVIRDVESLRNWLDGRLAQIEEKMDTLQRGQDRLQLGQDVQSETLARIEERLKEALAPKQAGENPLERQLPSELLDQARLLLSRGDREQQALAKIALRQHDDADQIIQELKQEPLAELFRLLTLEGNNWYNAGQFDRAIEPYEKAVTLRPDDPDALNNAAIAHCDARLGSIEGHQRSAITLLKHCADLTRNVDRATWAMTHNNLGIAWQNMPTGDRAENLGKAISAYESALEVYTRDAHPVRWATTQNNLGTAWHEMPTGDRAENLRNAISAYESALEVRTRDAHPVDWATTQNNLGNAWQEMPTGDRAENLRNAISAYDAALEVLTRDAHPVDWAATQNNLGIAWQKMPTGDRAEDLRKAISAYEAALEVGTREAHPVDWAGTQNNLGIAWASMPTGDRAQNLRKAISAYESALEVRTRDAHPVDWAATHHNLAFALADMAKIDGDQACYWLRRAISSGKAALLIHRLDAFPREHAATNLTLLLKRASYKFAGCVNEMPFDAIEPAQ